MELKWPREQCDCGFNFVQPPKPYEKGFNGEGKPIWTDFCPKCGKGYEVGRRDATAVRRHPEPGEILGEEPAPEIAPEPAPPEAETPVVTESQPSEKVEVPAPEIPVEPPPGYFYCPEHKSLHKLTSKIGKKCKKKLDAGEMKEDEDATGG